MIPPADRARVQVPTSRVHNQEMQDPGDGEHLWTAMVLFRVPADAVEAMKAGRELGPLNLDHENVLTLEMGCYKCESPFSRRMTHRWCTGSMGLQP